MQPLPTAVVTFPLISQNSLKQRRGALISSLHMGIENKLSTQHHGLCSTLYFIQPLLSLGLICPLFSLFSPLVSLLLLKDLNKTYTPTLGLDALCHRHLRFTTSRD